MVLSNMIVQLPPAAGEGSKPRWTGLELELVRRWYGTIPTKDIARKLHRTTRSVERKGFRLGLCKTRARLRQMGTENVDRRWQSGFCE